MVAPNIRNPSTIIGITTGTTLSTSNLTTVLTNTSNSGKVFKINSIFSANIDGVNTSTIDIALNNGSTDTYIAYTIDVPADSTQVISTKETYFYLQEGWSIKAKASASNDIAVTISYEEISNT
jgi:uncharacterized protein YaaQ